MSIGLPSYYPLTYPNPIYLPTGSQRSDDKKQHHYHGICVTVCNGSDQCDNACGGAIGGLDYLLNLKLTFPDQTFQTKLPKVPLHPIIC